jgi:hypothetical protein
MGRRTKEVNDVPHQWPTQPTHLPIPTLFIIISNAVVDVLSTATSISFFVFALVVLRYDSSETHLNPGISKALIRASVYVSTSCQSISCLVAEQYRALPCFPSFLPPYWGRATHAIMFWRLERKGGERLDILNTLAASTSFTNSIITQFRLRSINLIGLLLIVLWALSPIGGQATLRQVSIGTKVTTHPTQYVSIQGTSNISWINYEPIHNMSTQNIRAIYQASVLASRTTQDSPRDAWGHVKIPVIELYEDFRSPDPKGCFGVIEQSADKYASLVGVPIQLKSTNFIDHKFNINSRYIYMDCANHKENLTRELWTWTPYNAVGSSSKIVYNVDIE